MNAIRFRCMQASFCQNLVVACLVLESAVSGYSAPAKDKLCAYRFSVWFVAKQKKIQLHKLS